MKQILTILLVSLFIYQAQAAICEKYLSSISKDDIMIAFSKMYSCIIKKTKEIDNLKDQALSLELIQKQLYDQKFDCFQEIKNPSVELKELFQCYKNYYEARFDTSIKIPTLQDEEKGSDSENWGDEELKKKVEENYDDRKSSTNVALYIFCVVLGIAILALLVAIIFSKYRMHLSKEAAALGQSSFEFGSSNTQYQKQTNF